MKTHFLKWEYVYVGTAGFLFGIILCLLLLLCILASKATAAEQQPRSYGALDVITTTNFAGVTFAPVPCPHPGCGESHSVLATERYETVRDTWAEVVDAADKPTGENKRLFSVTNDWGSLTQEISHPAVYRMHTQPGYPVRPGTRWPGDLPPLPPWGASDSVAAPRRSNATTLPGDLVKVSVGLISRNPQSDHIDYIETDRMKAQQTRGVDTNLYGVLYNVGTNYGFVTILEKRSTDRSSGVRVWPGDAVERVTNQADVIARQAHGIYLPGDRIWLGNRWGIVSDGLSSAYVTNTVDGSTIRWWTNRGPGVMGATRFRAVPATNALPQARRFTP